MSVKTALKTLSPIKLLFWRNIASGRKIYFWVGIASILLIGTLITINSLIASNEAEAAWWNGDWAYRKSISITGGGENLTDYQFSFTLNTSSSDNNGLIKLGKMLSNCNDIRITDASGKELPFWMEEGSAPCNHTATKIWTKIPSISTTGTTIYLYYGNPSAKQSLLRDGNKVFELFDDFNSGSLNGGKWNQGTIAATSGTNMTQANGVLGGGNNSRYVQSNKKFTGNFSAQTRVQINTGAGNGFTTIGFYKSATDNLGLLDHNGTSYIRNDASWTSVTYNGLNQWNQDRVKAVGTTATYWRTGETSGSATNNVAITGISDEYIRVGARNDNAVYDQNFVANWDWIFVTKTTATEPTVAETGTEEQAPGPVAYWKLDEGTSSKIYDTTSNGNTGDINGATWVPEDQCISGHCLKFDGTNDYVNTNKDFSWSTSDSFSISLWIKPNSTTGVQGIMGKGEAGGYGTTNWEWRLNTNSSTLEFVYFNTSGQVEIGLSSSVQQGSWYHVYITYDPVNKAKMYLNGNLAVSDSSVGNTLQNRTTPTLLGHAYYSGGTNYYFNGFIDDVKVFNQERTLEQIRNDYVLTGSVKGASTQIANDLEKQGILAKDLIGYWKQDEATWSGALNEVMDSSGIGNHGSAQEPVNDKAYPASGKFGNAGYFDGINDYIDIASNVPMGTTEMSISAWIRPVDSSDGNRIIVTDYLNWDVRLGDCGSNASLMFTKWADWTAVTAPCGSISYNTWQHVMLTYKADNTVDIYVNGIKKATASKQTTRVNRPIHISHNSSGHHFAGQIDEVRIYKKAYSPSEVNKLYNWAPGPVGYWDFEEGTGQLVNDKSGYGNNGTWSVNGSHWDNGKYGKGGKFSTGLINAGSASSVDLNETLSYSFWIKGTAPVTAWSSPIEKTDFTTGWGCFVSDTGPNIYMRIDTSAATNQARGSISNVLDGKWHFISYILDRGTLVGYKDGVKVTEGTYNPGNGINPDPTSLLIGNSFDGLMDEVRVYNYVRTPSQIIEDMNAGHPIGGSPIASQVGYWKFDEGTGTTANDGSGQNNDCTLTNDSMWTNDGKFNKGLYFNGSTVASCGNGSSLDFGTKSFTVSMWYNFGTGTSNPYWSLGKGDTWSGAGFGVAHWQENDPIVPTFYLNDGIIGVGGVSLGGCTIQRGQWGYCAWTIDREAKLLKSYQNGKFTSQVSISTLGNISNSSPLLIGGMMSNRYNNGMMDEVKIYNAVLNDSQVMLDYNQGKSLVLGASSNTSGLSGGAIASNSASSKYCMPGDNATCSQPVGEWNFEEGRGGNVSDSSGNRLNGTWYGAGNHWTQGKYGKGAQFNGIDDAVVVTAGDNSLLDGEDGFTWELWVKRTGISSTQWPYLLGNDPHRYYGLRSNSFGDVINLEYGLPPYAGASWGSTGTVTLPLNTWTHLAVTYDGSTVRFYKNGQLTSTTTSVTLNPTFASALNINSGTFKGHIDDVKVFNYPRTTSQIAWDYNRAKPFAHFKFDECQGSTAKDHSGYGNNATIAIGATLPQTVVGTCSTPTNGTGAWYDGRSGKFNYSIDLDGQDDFVYVDDPGTSMFDRTTAVTLSTWIKPTVMPQVDNTGIAAKGDNYFMMFVGSEVRAYFWNGSAHRAVTTTNADIQQGRWNHVVMVYEPNNFRIYVNGVLKAHDTNIADTMAEANSPFVIGSDRQIPGRNFNGQIDEVQVYSYALNPTQIKNLYNQNSAVRWGPSEGAPN